MPKVRFIKAAWGHQPGDVVEFANDFVLAIVQEGAGVELEGQPPVERAVVNEPGKETATIKR
jgi:hypothetical protein